MGKSFPVLYCRVFKPPTGKRGGKPLMGMIIMKLDLIVCFQGKSLHYEWVGGLSKWLRERVNRST